MTSYKTIILGISALCLMQSTPMFASEPTLAPTIVSAAQVKRMQERINELESQLEKSLMGQARLMVAQAQTEKRRIKLEALMGELAYQALLSGTTPEERIAIFEHFEHYENRRDQILSTSK